MSTIVEAMIPHAGNSKDSQGYPVDSLRFDWIVTILSILLVIGTYIDGWAHNHNHVDNTFFTPWHAMLYGGFALVAAFLAVSMHRNIGNGYPVRRALPRGYALSMVGVIVFAFGGVGDLVWHSLFGIELSVDALLSPTHLLLALGLLLIVSGPIRAAWHRFVPEATRGWNTLGPLVICATLVLSGFIFFTHYAHPLYSSLAAHKSNNAPPKTDIFTMNVDGSNQTRLTLDPGEDLSSATISPNGDKAVFSLEAADKNSSDLYVIKPDGLGKTRLTNIGGYNINPAWSNDGSKIAFVSRNSTTYDIYNINSDGSKAARLASMNSPVGMLSWSTDGKYITFSANRSGTSDIYMMNADGTTIKTLTSDGIDSFSPSFSPDGNRIVFFRDVKVNPRWLIYTINVDGSGLIKMGDQMGFDPRWSPDGSKIVFGSYQNDRGDIYSMKLDGSGFKNLTNNAAFNSDGPTWSSDGSKIFYHVSIPSSVNVDFFNQALGVSGILLQAGFLMGVILFLVKYWILPFGVFTLMITATSLMIITFHDHYELIPAALVAGLLADVLLWWLKPSTAQSGRFYLFAFAVPAVFYSLYFVAVYLTQGITWTIHMWAGAIVQAGVIGLLEGFLLLPPFAVIK